MSDADNFFRRAEAILDRLERFIPAHTPTDLTDGIAWRWRKHGDVGRLHRIDRFNPITLDDLQQIDHQKQGLIRNTRQFLRGLPANNALLWGPRGTGKSSLIKALFNRYCEQGLKLIEVERQELVDLPEIVEQLHGVEGKFIVFCDDLSFDEKDSTYRALKVVLDGSVLSTPDNLIIYATSNRRHLVPERLNDNLDAQHVDGEIHQSEAVEEKISLSERFGLWLSFHPFNQNNFLSIVDHWIEHFNVLNADKTSVRRAALQWAMLHGSRSGRSAYQFAKDWAGRSALNNIE
ncbi:MAG: ATP-binding protein [Gammaproteobacteria bacterium]